MPLLALLTIALQDAPAPASTALRLEGWVFMILSVSFVTLLTGWCFYKVLTTPEQKS